MFISWKDLRCGEFKIVSLILTLTWTYCHAWLPDSSSKLTNNLTQIVGVKFTGSNSFSDHFIVLHQDETSLLVGGRNKVYNLSAHDLTERENLRLEWQSSYAHSQLCSLKGKTEDDCQNYIRIFERIAPGKLLVCGTNSYKPLCRHYLVTKGNYEVEKEIEGIGICPFDPEHNSTFVYSNGQLYSATVADFSGTDPLIYREPQRTELSDLKQLNAPNFVSSIPYGDYIFFFYRETAVEYMNCGKIIYSRVARICKEDKGGPHQYKNSWTSFLKARLNCSVPGEYPFYFDEIQSTSDIVEGNYGSDASQKIVYGALTTSVNAIGGSAICAFNLADILKAFEGTFKHQEGINSNWLPLPKERIPEPRPGQCVKDSRLLPGSGVTFVKMHSLMEDTVPAMFGRPLLIRVSLHYRFTSIAVDPQVKTVDGEVFDVLYIGTDNGKILKVVNIPTGNTTQTVVISENSVLPNGAAVKQIKISTTSGKIIVVSKDEVRMLNLNHCGNVQSCKDCIVLQDPHCAWDTKEALCMNVHLAVSRRNLIQDVINGNSRKCSSPLTDNKKILPKIDNVTEDTVMGNDINEDITDPLIKIETSESTDCDGLENNEVGSCAVHQRLFTYTPKMLLLVVFGAILAGLFSGFVAGYWVSKKSHHPLQYPDVPFIEQRNHLDRLSGRQNSYLAPRANKAVNLEVNVVPSNSPPPKKDNLDASKDLNIASDGTLQKIKKTYI